MPNHKPYKSKRNINQDINNNQQFYTLFGINPVRVALLRRPMDVLSIVVTDDTWSKISNVVPEYTRVTFVANNEIDHFANRVINVQRSGKINHQGIIAEIKIKQPLFLNDITMFRRVLVLDRLTDIGNIASIVRSAVCFGFKAILFKTKNAPDLLNPEIYNTLCRLSSGASELIEFYGSDKFTFDINKIVDKFGFKLIGLDGFKGEEIATIKRDIAMQDKIAIVIGSEGFGISTEMKNMCTALVKIQMQDGLQNIGLDSLNASIAASIAMYEFI